jgi:hypothetical protein
MEAVVQVAVLAVQAMFKPHRFVNLAELLKFDFLPLVQRKTQISNR